MHGQEIETGNMEMIRHLIGSDGDCVDFSVSLKFDQSRYEWRVVNWSRFLYDKSEDVYIPESVVLDMISSRLDHIGV